MKYRIWDKIQNKFVSNIVLDKDGNLIKFYKLTIDTDWSYLTPRECVNRYLISICSSIKDKNGKEIFEGDIIKVIALDPGLDKYNDKVGTVVFRYGSFWVEFEDDSVLLYQELLDYEIIENIYKK